MSTSKKLPKKRTPKGAVKMARPTTPTAPKADALMLHELWDLEALTPVIQKSYVLSRFWAWWVRIQLRPNVRIPVPRFLSYRDP